MQPGVTVVLATVWLVVYANVVGTAYVSRPRRSFDQYTLLLPKYETYGRDRGELDSKDQNPADNQPFDLSIDPRRSIPTSDTGSQEQSSENKNLELDSLLRRLGNSADDDFSPLVEDKQPRNSTGREFTDEKTDGKDTKGPESASRELSPPSELEDPFVADDTFQDQGPGSVEIYKLNLNIEKPLLHPTPITRFLSKGKSKTPKKTNHGTGKTKPTEYKATSPKMLYKQSNSFDDSSTEVPPNIDPFSIGGVPELQVGCEGLAASDNPRLKRSIEFPDRDKKPSEVNPWADVTPISLDLDYEFPGEDGYEEVDELLKLKKLEMTTKRVGQNRGDMDATLHSDFYEDKRHAEKLPVRGDLGKSSVNNDSVVLPPMADQGIQKTEEKAADEPLHFNKGKRDEQGEAKSADSPISGANQRRKILWFDDSEDAEQSENERRSKRGIWGFGEDDGVVSSDELQTENERRRQTYEKAREEEEWRRQEEERRRREEEQRRSYMKNRTNSDIEKIREEYEKSLEQSQREEEERWRRLQQQQSQRPSTNRWQQEEEQRRRSQEEDSRRNRWQDEERRRQELEASRRRYGPRPQSSTYEEERNRQRQQEEEMRQREEDRLREEQRRQRLQQEETRRREQNRREEEMKRRQQQELDRRNIDERRREWMLKQRKVEEEKRRKQQQSRNEPSNLVYPTRANSNESRRYDTEVERRMREQRERERQQKLNEYIHRNRPINVIDRQREEANRRRQEEERRRLEEERKLQEYIRRNQPVRVPNVNESNDRSLEEYRRRLDEARQYNRSRYPGPGSGRRNHGPSAPTNIDSWRYVDEAKRREATRRIEEERIRERQRQQQEQLRREALKREEEARRMQSRRYEEERKRQEAARLEAARRAKEQLELETWRRSQARRRFEEHGRRQDTSLIPTNLLLNESRRAMELERQRQEQERRKLEAEWRRQEDSRAKEARVNEQRTSAMKEQLRRREEARLNALPVNARIIVHHTSSSSFPNVIPRMGTDTDTDTDIDLPGVNPYNHGVKVPGFPASPTRRPPAKSPTPCVWAITHCCSSNTNRLVTCFESMGCPGAVWDYNPCAISVVQSARETVMNFYNERERDDRRR